MDDPQELKFAGTPEELVSLRHSDFCVTLYTVWDRLRERGEMAGRRLYTCRNDSCVPDSVFAEFARQALVDCEVMIDRGEVYVLTAMTLDPFRASMARVLNTALDTL